MWDVYKTVGKCVRDFGDESYQQKCWFKRGLSATTCPPINFHNFRELTTKSRY